jgi:hypothetical protein
VHASPASLPRRAAVAAAASEAAPKASKASASSASAASAGETAEERAKSLAKQLSRVEEELALARQMGTQAVARAEKAEARWRRRPRCA